MALAKAALQMALAAAMNDAGVPGETKAAYITRVTTNMANAIDTYVKTGTVSVPGTGLVAPSGGGPVTGAGTGTIS